MKFLQRLFYVANDGHNQQRAVNDEVTNSNTTRASALYSVTFQVDSSCQQVGQQAASGKVSFFAHAEEHCLPLKDNWLASHQSNILKGSGNTTNQLATTTKTATDQQDKPPLDDVELKKSCVISQPPTSKSSWKHFSNDDSEDDWILIETMEQDNNASISANDTNFVHCSDVDSKEYCCATDRQLEQMALDKTDIDLIRVSWEPVRKEPGNSGLLLFKDLFTKFPEYKHYFPQFVDLNLERMHENKRLNKHALKVIETITYIVDAIGDESKANELSQALTNLVQSHLMKGIGVPEFRNLGIILIDFICDINRRGAKLDTNQLVTAWTKLYSIILTLVKRQSDSE